MLNRFRKMPINRQLSITAGASIIVFTIALTAITSTLISRQLRDEAVTDARLQTEQFAERTLFAFLVDDPTVAEDAILSITSFPTIEYASLVRNDGALVAASPQESQHRVSYGSTPRHLTQVQEERDHWLVTAPVISLPPSQTPDAQEQAAEYVGSVTLAFSKAPVRDAIETIWIINGFAGLTAAGIYLALLSFQMRAVTDPLRALSRTMSNGGRNSPRKRANIVGSKETREIANVYNNLMDAVDQAQAALQSEVEIRTEELKAARDAALAANRQKSEIMAAVTHEMKTPLTAIIGYAQLTLEDLEFAFDVDAAENSREQLENILGRAHELLRQITQMLDLARAEAGKFEINLTEQNIAELLETTLKSVQPLAAEHGNETISKFDVTSNIFIDADKFHQIVLNLLTNACKFTTSGRVLLTCAVDRTKVRLKVEDTGIGMAADVLETIFEPFYQIDMSQSRSIGGTGLGLALSRQFARLMGGDITVRSKPNEGSVFVVEIPLPVNSIV